MREKAQKNTERDLFTTGKRWKESTVLWFEERGREELGNRKNKVLQKRGLL